MADAGRTVAVISTTEVPTGQMVVNTGQRFPAIGQVMSAVEGSVRSARFLDASGLARQLFDDEQYANMILVGVAYQAGALPIGAAAIEHAIRLNGVAVEANIAAFRRGRLSVTGPAPEQPDEERRQDQASLAELLAVRVPELVAYQDAAYANAYADLVEHVRAREAEVAGGDLLARTVAANLFKLAAYKDEYEVARLSLDPALTERIEQQFGAGARYAYRLHPPVLRALGMRRKISLGPWFRPAFRTLVATRRLRGTAFDPFGRTVVRREERALLAEYRAVITRLADALTTDNHTLGGRDRRPARSDPRLRGGQARQRARLPRAAGGAAGGVRRWRRTERPDRAGHGREPLSNSSHSRSVRKFKIFLPERSRGSS